jgi:hypothetical protein
MHRARWLTRGPKTIVRYQNDVYGKWKKRWNEQVKTHHVKRIDGRRATKDLAAGLMYPAIQSIRPVSPVIWRSWSGNTVRVGEGRDEHLFHNRGTIVAGLDDSNRVLVVGAESVCKGKAGCATTDNDEIEGLFYSAKSQRVILRAGNGRYDRE